MSLVFKDGREVRPGEFQKYCREHQNISQEAVKNTDKEENKGNTIKEDFPDPDLHVIKAA